MSSAAMHRLVTDRDMEILTALGRCPLSTPQLFTISSTFERPFTNERRLRERMQHLAEAGRVRSWQYATTGRRAPNYYRLSPLGFRILHGHDCGLPTRRAFQPVSLGKQEHTKALADFVVHTAVCAHRRDLSFTEFYPENDLRLEIGDESLFPDAAWHFVDAAGQRYRYFLEIDAGTERIRSRKDSDSWERKIRLYDAYQDLCSERFRVLCVSVWSAVRPKHILAAAAELLKNPERSLLYAISLPEYLAQRDALRARCFRDHRGTAVSLLPRRPPRVGNFLKPRPILAVG